MKKISHTTSLRQTAYGIMLFVLLVIFGYGCDWVRLKKGTSPEEPYVARVHEKYLYYSDLQKKYPGQMDVEDSIFWTKNFINVWIHDQLLLYQAMQNLPDNEKDFSSQVEDYKNSLIRYAYETRLIEQNLDTIISDQQIRQYYEEHLGDFKLNRDIVKALYVVVWKDSTNQIKEIKKMLLKKDVTPDELEYYCSDYEFPFYNTDTTRWMYFDDVLDKTPFSIENKINFLRYARTMEQTDDKHWNYIKIFNYKLQNDDSPIELERERVKKIILSKRKEVLIKTLRRDIFEDAQKNGDFEII